MVKHTQTIRQQKLTYCLSVFDHFVRLALKCLIFWLFGVLAHSKQTKQNKNFTSTLQVIEGLEGDL